MGWRKGGGKQRLIQPSPSEGYGALATKELERDDFTLNRHCERSEAMTAWIKPISSHSSYSVAAFGVSG
jgi:hypothetical protein